MPVVGVAILYPHRILRKSRRKPFHLVVYLVDGFLLFVWWVVVLA